MAFSSGSSAASSAEINVTPLIDVLLVLLVIFMVVQPVTSQGLESSVPQGKAAPRAGLGPVVVHLQGNDPLGLVRYRIGGTELAAAELEGRLRSMFAVREDRTLFVEADRGLSFGQVAVVVGHAREAGAGSVVLSRFDPGR